ncbi:trypsin-like peptidase domain-containing protein [Patulibacter brassicae]|jgi:S1-C subfamily serine protease|uniref:Trypsin-like peptidase domain-containing protein n=1 Tax=Patulibacter brassicae TaxID=1705717 RepID=A0ABU4VKY0_9ACTN|nr:trypsin-like peptidase domain-containing protein [Patulibacter brassicae]MDX8151744.1 trypsin-like peptidase domain-containing protein [Patulibacter brassicae]
MTSTRPAALLAGLALLPAAALGLAACGDDEDGAGAGAITTRTVEVVREAQDGGEAAASASGRTIDAARIYERFGPGVVTVLTQGRGGRQALDSDSGLGSGFVVSDDGLVVTNAHVVTGGEGEKLREADEVFVRFADRNQVPAKILGFDPFNDVALLKVDPRGLRLVPLRFASARSLTVGEPVVAIGSPFGEEQSVSIGVVSALDRSIRSLTGFETVDAIQTDAAINRGNSGGPLLDGDGRVLGINSQIETTSGDGSGVGFAVSAETVRRAVRQLRRDGKVAYPYLGVSTVDVYPQLAKRFGLGVDHGAWVQEVPDGGPGEKAGVRPSNGDAKRFQVAEYRTGGDVVVAIDDQEIRSSTDLAEVALRFRPGQTVTLRVYRDGKPRNVRLTLAERPRVLPR